MTAVRRPGPDGKMIECGQWPLKGQEEVETIHQWISAVFI